VNVTTEYTFCQSMTGHGDSISLKASEERDEKIWQKKKASK